MSRDAYLLTIGPTTGAELDLSRLRGLAIADAAVRFRRLRGEHVAFAPVLAADAPLRERLEGFAIGLDFDDALAPGDDLVRRWAGWLLERAGADRLYRRDGEWRLRAATLHADSERRLDALDGWSAPALAAQRELLAHVDAPPDGGDELEASLSKLAAAGWSVDNKKDKGPPEVHFAAGDLPVARGESWESPEALHPRFADALARLLAALPAAERSGAQPGDVDPGRWLPAVLTVADRDSAEALLDLRTVAKALRDFGGAGPADGEPLGPVLAHRPLRLRAVRRRPTVNGAGPTAAGHVPDAIRPRSAHVENESADPTAAGQMPDAIRPQSAHVGRGEGGGGVQAGDVNDVEALAAVHGGEAVRFAVLHAAAPEKRFAGGEDVVGYAARLLAETRELADGRIAAAGPGATIDLGDGLRRRLARWCETAVARSTANHENHAPHLAARNAVRLLERIRAFEQAAVTHRGQLAGADREAVAVAVGILARLLEPLAPATAAELLAAAPGAPAGWPAALGEPARA